MKNRTFLPGLLGLLVALAACSPKPLPQQSTAALPVTAVAPTGAVPAMVDPGTVPATAMMAPAAPALAPGELMNRERQDLISRFDTEINALAEQIKSADNRYKEIDREARTVKKQRNKLQKQQKRLQKEQKDLQKNDPREQWERKKADTQKILDESSKQRQN